MTVTFFEAPALGGPAAFCAGGVLTFCTAEIGVLDGGVPLLRPAGFLVDMTMLSDGLPPAVAHLTRSAAILLDRPSYSADVDADDVVREVREVPCDAATAGCVCHQPGV